MHMANLAAILKSEISRLARRELRSQVDALKKGVTQQRRTIANLRKQVDGLERQLRQVTAGARRNAAPSATEGGEDAQGLRFQAKGFKSWRAKSKLSAEQVAKLLDVSAQSIYNWEAKKVRPRPAQIAAIAELRAIGKRQIVARLEGVGSTPAAADDSTPRKPGRRPGRKPAAKSAAKPAAASKRARRGGRKAKSAASNEAAAAA
jgi:DNA-binding transcriptional regulator YiaG